MELVFPAGDDFVGVTLMADVPDEVVFFHVEDVVEGEGYFDDSEGRTEVAAVSGDGLYDFGANFLSQDL